MSVSTIFQKAIGIATIYGKPLYELVEVLGEINPLDYVLDEVDGVVSITEDDKTIYIPIRRSVMEQGLEDDQIFTIGKFQATRDEQGEFNGEQWVVDKGTVKLFAY